MGQRLAAVGFILAVIVALFMFTQQQQALKDAQLAQTLQADMDTRRGTAVAMAQSASDAQASAEAVQGTAVAQAQGAATAQSKSDSHRETAVAEARAAGTLGAQLGAAATEQYSTAQAAQSAAVDAANQQSTLMAESTAELGTAQAQIDMQATAQAGFDAALGTATAQVDLAEFARQAAEEDRATALAQFWIAATVVANQSDTQATAQAIVSGVTAAPTAIPVTPTLAPTAAVEANPTSSPNTQSGAIPPLTATYTSSDKSFSFNYPEGWVAGDSGQGVILVVSSQDILQRSSSDLKSGELEIQMIVGPATNIRGVQAGATPTEVLKAVRDIYASQNTNQLSDSSEVTIGNHAGARFGGIEGNNAAVITVLDLGNGRIALTFAYMFPGETDRFTPVLDDILASLSYQA
jgi:hypothetical protein